MLRLHRSLIKRAAKIDPTEMANRAEDYLDSAAFYKSEISGIGGLVKTQRIRNIISKIDKLEREMIRLEEKLGRAAEKRAILAAQLEEMVMGNIDVLSEYLPPEELREFQ